VLGRSPANVKSAPIPRKAPPPFHERMLPSSGAERALFYEMGVNVTSLARRNSSPW
jgi:hypothetical protein